MEKRYNDSQVKAIGHFNGPCLTLAGPGSGKTAVITERTKNLITKYHVNPSNILVITFTRAAATEMKERFLKLSDNRYSGVCFQTFHSFFFMILRKAYGYRADNIITQQEQTITMQIISSGKNKSMRSCVNLYRNTVLNMRMKRNLCHPFLERSVW